jgi:hypothetical protein
LTTSLSCFGLCDYEIENNNISLTGDIITNFHDKLKSIHQYISYKYDIPFIEKKTITMKFSYDNLLSNGTKPLL